jgi:GDPmannose 4,6-dehydratase
LRYWEGNVMARKALITGITGQDGSYLAELLLHKGYEVHGIKRRTSSRNVARIEHLFNSDEGIEGGERLVLHHGDLTDGSSLHRIISGVAPDEIYNLAAQSHVKVSFEEPEYTANSDALGVLRILEIIRGLEKRPRFYQASTSELYGGQSNKPLDENTPFEPRSPYGAAKQYAFYISKIYREAYGIFAVNGILFNHESPRRGENFVTKKITRGIAEIIKSRQHVLVLGNLDAVRDWGHARDYVYAQWLMLQQAEARDYVVATGNAISVRDFVNICFGMLGVELSYQGTGSEEVGIVKAIKPAELQGVPRVGLKIGQVVLRVNPLFYRPLEVNHLLGDASRARRELEWEPTVSINELAREMLTADLAAVGER